LTNLLAQRGISTYDEAKTFFRPSLRSLHDPFLLKDMDKAVDRIIEAMQNRERILVYGDYDVDGTTAVALIYLFLRRMSADVDYYIPDRYSEGYGISLQGIEYAHEHGFSLIIALDCGIKAVEKVKEAQKRDIDFIICDHHRPGEELPPAVAVLDPKRTDCEYPYKELSGCGVGFKLIQAFALRNNIPFRDLVQYLDLVVVASPRTSFPSRAKTAFWRTSVSSNSTKTQVRASEPFWTSSQQACPSKSSRPTTSLFHLKY